MFTGIVQDVGRILAREERAGDLRIRVGVERLDLARTGLGDSIAVAGVCLTAVAVEARAFSVDVSRATLAVTTIGSWQIGRAVNLEQALRVGDALGGHWVAGHVDGLAQLLARGEDARSLWLRVRAPAGLERYIVRKGSVALDGVSLTVNAVHGAQLELNIVPHTLTATTLAQLAAGDLMHIEVDLMARYVEGLLGAFAESRNI